MSEIEYIVRGPGWLEAPPHPDEPARVARLHNYEILDTTPEESFDRVTRLAATWFNVPVSYVTLVDKERQWFKSCFGSDATQTDRSLSFCAMAILQDGVMVIPDTTKDNRVYGNPVVTGDAHIRFYAGAPLLTSDGLKLGTLCIVDNKPRIFTKQDCEVLESLAALVMDEMDLRMARQKAEKENEQKSQYVSYISHEVRTPLTTIQSALSLTRSREHDTETQGYLDLISHATDILLETINDFLDLARMETRSIELEEIPFHPEGIVQQVYDLMKLRAKPGVTLTTENAGAQNVTLMGDPTRLRQILINFCGNAVKFTEAGTIQILSSIIENKKGSARWRLEVTDSGCGIPAEKLPRLFEKFSQADNSTARQYGGSGLGLHITKILAELMHGQVGASSNAGKGSTFWFEAPFEISAESVHIKPHVISSHIPPCHILLAEDNSTNQMLIKAMLKREGHSVVTASNGLQAVDAAIKEKFDLILMDCQMPDMDGLEATAKIRIHSDALSKNVPILALTANASSESRERCMACGMNDFVSKPVAIEQLQLAIGRWVKKAKVA
ncbi:MAG: ATP-binding protein [Pseudomonadota bacterium]